MSVLYSHDATEKSTLHNDKVKIFFAISPFAMLENTVDIMTKYFAFQWRSLVDPAGAEPKSDSVVSMKWICFGHVLRGRLPKGRCNIRVYVPVCVPVCVCVCVYVCVLLSGPSLALLEVIIWSKFVFL